MMFFRGKAAVDSHLSFTVLRSNHRWTVILCLVISITLSTGCASSNKWVSLRTTPRNPLADTLGLFTKKGPNPTPRTIQLLRRYDLAGKLEGDRKELLNALDAIDAQQPSREHAYAQAELAYVGAKRAERSLNRNLALELYGSSVMHSYRYLFDEKYARPSSPYDPEFRRACDLYNAALEGVLRIAKDQSELLPGTTIEIRTAHHDCKIEIQLQSDDWKEEDVDRFEFVSDYEVHGLRNHYHNFGLGVPLIAIRRNNESTTGREEFYPEDVSFPLTAFLRVNIDSTQGDSYQLATLELHDPLDQPSVLVAGRTVPLETDLSTPLAYTLSQPSLDDNHLSTLGLLKPDRAKDIQGLYMLEPFQEDKIPVVMVHGLWSSPVTWMEMFNDLRSDPEIRNHYQFWFYMYPTGQPFWISGAQMRENLTHMRRQLDPDKQFVALDQTVLVGHSMGGLVSKLQTVDSGNQFWNLLSDRPFSELDADPEMRESLARTFFFDPNPSIRRVVTIGTPHRGSEFANDATRWLGRKLIRIPNKILQGRNQLVSRNPGYFRPDAPLNINTSIDSLAPDSPLLPVLLSAQHASWVQYHNVMGEVPNKGFTSWIVDGEGDGVVTLENARLDNVSSQIIVPADHVSVHRHPQSIMEVRRILLQHVSELKSLAADPGIGHLRVPNMHDETSLHAVQSWWPHAQEADEESAIPDRPATAVLHSILDN